LAQAFEPGDEFAFAFLRAGIGPLYRFRARPLAAGALPVRAHQDVDDRGEQVLGGVPPGGLAVQRYAER
jgi:hypothetical protein